MKKIITLLFFIPYITYGQNFGNALHFDGVDDQLQTVAPSNLGALLNSEFTIEMWLNLGVSNTTRRVFFAQQNGSNFVSILLNSSSIPFFYVYVNGAVNTFVCTDPIPTNVWTHVAFTWQKTGNNGKIYYNGVLKTVTNTGGISSTQYDNTMTIGRQGNGSYPYLGAIDEFRFWSKERTQCQILATKNVELNSTTNLVCYYKFNEGIAGGNNNNISTVSDFTNNYHLSTVNLGLNGATSNFITSGAVYLPNGGVPSSQLDITTCNSYTWSTGTGLTYTNSTQDSYTYIGQAANGCDSIVFLNLTINEATSSTITEMACGSFTWTEGTGETYTTDTTLSFTTVNSNGCDSVITLNLTVNHIDSSISVNNITISANLSGATYQWIDCINGNAIIGANGQSFTATSNGHYAVEISSNGCTSQSECIEIYSVGLAENNNSNWNLYPNPSNGKFYLSGIEKFNVVADIINIEGKSIQKISLNKQQNEIDLTNYPQGIYVLKLNDGSLFKLVKQ